MNTAKNRIQHSMLTDEEKALFLPEAKERGFYEYYNRKREQWLTSGLNCFFENENTYRLSMVEGECYYAGLNFSNWECVFKLKNETDNKYIIETKDKETAIFKEEVQVLRPATESERELLEGNKEEVKEQIDEDLVLELAKLIKKIILSNNESSR